MGLGLSSEIKAVFVDFFDTLMFRRITPEQVLEQWAVCIGRKYPTLSEKTIERLPEIRKRIFESCRKKREANGLVTGRWEVDYRTAMTAVYKRINHQGYLGNPDTFLEVSREIDLAVEIGCQYMNRRLMKKLKRLKKAGKKIYIVSDFYLSTEELKKFITAAGENADFFDGIFVSCDTGKRKAIGSVYPWLLHKLGYRSDQVMMIGDNPVSDRKNPAIYGIHTVLQRHILHKIWNHLKAEMGVDFRKRQMKLAIKDMYRYGAEYGEYSALFYVFTRRLWKQIKQKNGTRLSFMAREGYLLQKFFDKYQQLTQPETEKIETMYYRCSRRSVMAGIREAHLPENIDGEISLRNWLKSLDISLEEAKEYGKINEDEADSAGRLEDLEGYRNLMENPEFREEFNQITERNRKNLLAYTEPFLDKKVFRFVDSGWKCTTQNALEQFYQIHTEGYYIGTQKPDHPIGNIEKHGLIFQEDPESRFYSYLGMNIPFYQQLLAAPHGTVLSYVEAEGEITVKEEWDPMEKKLYETKIKKVQEYMQLKFRGFCVWDDQNREPDKEDWMLAKMAMKSSLFAKGRRQEFVRFCTDNYVQNFQQEKRGKVNYDPGKIKIGPEIIWKPEKLLRYASKVPRTELYDRKTVRIFYPVAARTLYLYILLFQSIKNIFCYSYEKERGGDSAR